MNPLQFDKIDSQSVVGNVVNQISSLIINKEYTAGDKIPTETELAEKLGVSRNSIREAIKILSAIGILEIQRGRGTFVASKVSPSFFDPLIFSLIIEPKSASDIYEFRVMFESMIIFSAMDKITSNQLIELKALVDLTRERWEKDHIESVDFYVKQDLLFHQTLLEMTANPLIQRVGLTIMQFIPEYIGKSISQKNGIERSIINHERIISALERKDKDCIINIIEDTLSEWKDNWSE
ncbi:FadR/GntR family transcriptional regulator [Fusibacter bizertensis]|uniref:FadR/GntR family transcriptional regulator n=1 Tax=Fusibacter bizertensis TaxID=1488331 RepID=A0ABT6NCD1_9FIRM|nr:FadR/GntR family transcriptional regulator [Fusibacter bizertensis]MDH8678078.1 FadR/GntR family transcriptional regulator [Fusibacter bizertensis]